MSKLFVLPENWHRHSISRMLILILTLAFSISNPKPIFEQFGPKNSKLSIMPENWHTWCLEDYDSHCDTSFLDFQTKVYFWTELGPGNGIICFV